MSSSPESGPQDFPQIPRGGTLWPLAVLAFLLGASGLYLMLPNPTRPAPLPLAEPSPRASATAPRPGAGVVRLAIVDRPDSTFEQTARLFAEQIRALTRGALQIEVLPEGRIDGQRSGELEIMRRVQEGRLPLAFVSVSPLTNAAPELAVLDLPFIFDSYEHADRVLDGPLGRELLENLRPSGLVGLAYLETGFRILSSAVPLPDLASLKDRRIRVMQSPVYVNFVQALGAEPVPSAVDRIHEMGRQGFIDAADRSYPTYWDFRLYEVHRNITESNHAYSAKVVVANRDWWDRLPAPTRLALQQAARQAEVEHRTRQRQEQSRVKRQVAQARIAIFTLSAEERERFRAQHGPGLVHRLRQEADLGRRHDPDGNRHDATKPGGAPPGGEATPRPSASPDA